MQGTFRQHFCVIEMSGDFSPQKQARLFAIEPTTEGLHDGFRQLATLGIALHVVLAVPKVVVVHCRCGG